VLDTFKSWDNWKETLGKAVNLGETAGLSDKTIDNIAERVGTFLANNVHPRNDEEKLLRELWDAANENDRKILAKLVVKIADK
jgi:hypothetical protein